MFKKLPTLAAIALSGALLVGCSSGEEPVKEPVKEKPTWSTTPSESGDPSGTETGETNPDDEGEGETAPAEDPFKDLKEYKKDGKTFVEKDGLEFVVEKDSEGNKTYRENNPTEKEGRVDVKIPKFEGMGGKEVQDYLKKYDLDAYGVHVQFIDMDTRAFIADKEVYKYSVCETSFKSQEGKEISFGAEEYLQFFMKVTC